MWNGLRTDTKCNWCITRINPVDSRSGCKVTSTGIYSSVLLPPRYSSFGGKAIRAVGRTRFRGVSTCIEEKSHRVSAIIDQKSAFTGQKSAFIGQKSPVVIGLKPTIIDQKSATIGQKFAITDEHFLKGM